MKRGFTMVEIVIVIAVLTILSTIGIFSANLVMEQARTSEATSDMNIIHDALERYYSTNGEYPSAASLAGSGDGRALSDAQYTSISSTLGVKKDILKGGVYKFVPCSVGNALCCTMNSSGSCVLPDTDATTRYVFYMTRTATEAANGAKLTFQSPGILSGCTYSFNDTTAPNDLGYTGYFLMYRNRSDSNTSTTWRVYSGDHGQYSSYYGCTTNNFS